MLILARMALSPDLSAGRQGGAAGKEGKRS
jgi:hypothetical protein